MAIVSKWLPYQTAYTAISSASMNALANAAYVYGSEIDNSTNLYLYADLEIVLSTSVTSVSPASISIFVLPNVGTGNYVASSGNPGSTFLRGTGSCAGGAITVLQVTGILLPPGKFKVVVQNNLGAAFPATNTSTALLYPYSEQSV